jgi:acetyl-CoA C-acetyltransferase
VIIGSFQGAFDSLAAHDLGAVAIKEVLKRANIEPAAVSEVILGQALQAGQGQNPARQASLKAGLTIETPAYGLNMLCGSGLKSVALGFQAIRNGDSSIVIAGGQESMTKSPHVIHLRGGTKMGNTPLVDTMINDGLTDAMNKIHMGETAELLAQQYQVSRADQDAAAAKSQNLAEAAQKAGYFDEEIVPVQVPGRKETVTVAKDEYIKVNSKTLTL